MAVSRTLDQILTTESTNKPSGSDNVGADLDDYLRNLAFNVSRAARYEVTATVSAAATLAKTIISKTLPVSGSAGGTTTLILPTAASAGTGAAAMFVKVDTANNVIIDGSSAETVDGSANATLTQQYESILVVSDPDIPGWYIAGSSRRWRGDLDVAGSTTLGTLSVSASAIFAAPVTLSDTLTAVGAVVAKSTFVAEGNVTINSGARLDVQGEFNVGTLTASATAVFKSAVIVEGAANTSTTVLTPGATIAIDFATGNDFQVTLDQNSTLGQPSNQTVGQSGIITVIQDSTARTLAYHADWYWADGTAPTITTGSGDVNIIAYHVRAANYVVASYVGGAFA